jgi:hypothetical protein
MCEKNKSSASYDDNNLTYVVFVKSTHEYLKFLRTELFNAPDIVNPCTECIITLLKEKKLKNSSLHFAGDVGTLFKEFPLIELRYNQYVNKFKKGKRFHFFSRHTHYDIVNYLYDNRDDLDNASYEGWLSVYENDVLMESMTSRRI